MWSLHVYRLVASLFPGQCEGWWFWWSSNIRPTWYLIRQEYRWLLDFGSLALWTCLRLYSRHSTALLLAIALISVIPIADTGKCWLLSIGCGRLMWGVRKCRSQWYVYRWLVATPVAPSEPRIFFGSFLGFDTEFIICIRKTTSALVSWILLATKQPWA